MLKLLLLMLTALFSGVTLAADINLTNIEFNSQSEGGFQVRLNFDAVPPCLLYTSPSPRD